MLFRSKTAIKVYPQNFSQLFNFNGNTEKLQSKLKYSRAKREEA